MTTDVRQMQELLRRSAALERANESAIFTPTLAGQSTAGTTTYVTRIGLYERDGAKVTATLYLGWTAVTGTGNMLVTDLPYTARNVTNIFYATKIWYTGITFAAGSGIQGLIRPNTSQRFGTTRPRTLPLPRLRSRRPAICRSRSPTLSRRPPDARTAPAPRCC
jgi:hypothetical protein